MFMSDREKMASALSEIFAYVYLILLRGLFAYSAWNILAPHLNAPLFTFWEATLIVLAFRNVFLPMTKTKD